MELHTVSKSSKQFKEFQRVCGAFGNNFSCVFLKHVQSCFQHPQHVADSDSFIKSWITELTKHNTMCHDGPKLSYTVTSYADQQAHVGWLMHAAYILNIQTDCAKFPRTSQYRHK